MHVKLPQLLIRYETPLLLPPLQHAVHHTSMQAYMHVAAWSFVLPFSIPH